MSLQTFILAMIQAPRDKLAGADVAKLAAKYEIAPDVAAFYLRMWRQ